MSTNRQTEIQEDLLELLEEIKTLLTAANGLLTTISENTTPAAE